MKHILEKKIDFEKYQLNLGRKSIVLGLALLIVAVLYLIAHKDPNYGFIEIYLIIVPFEVRNMSEISQVDVIYVEDSKEGITLMSDYFEIKGVTCKFLLNGII